MLKKLFISLLILSTLASEGLVNFPANIFSFYLANGKVFDLLEKEAAADEHNKNIVPETNASTSKVMGSGSFVLSANSFSKLRYEILNESNNINVNLYEPIIKLGIVDSVTYPLNRLITFHCSDASPPQFFNNSL